MDNIAFHLIVSILSVSNVKKTSTVLMIAIARRKGHLLRVALQKKNSGRSAIMDNIAFHLIALTLCVFRRTLYAEILKEVIGNQFAMYQG